MSVFSQKSLEICNIRLKGGGILYGERLERSGTEMLERAWCFV